jgi:hypothetical protein
MIFVRKSKTLGMRKLTHTEEGRLLVVQTGTEMEWLGIRRKVRASVQHHTCCFGINHSMRFSDHHLYMIDIVSEDG